MARLIGMEYWTRVNEALGGNTLRSICDKAGISYDTVRGARCRHRLLRPDTAMQLAEALGTTNDFLMGGEPLDEVPEEPINDNMNELITLCECNPGMAEKLLAIAKIMMA